MQEITPFLWFDGQAEEASAFYASLFAGGTWRVAVPGPDGKAMVTSFTIKGLNFAALNGGPHYKMSPGTSFMIDCEDQAEVDHLWDNLSAGGTTMACGWLTDRFGVTWQVIPKRFFELMRDGTPAQSNAVFMAMQSMVKMDIATLEAAFNGAA